MSKLLLFINKYKYQVVWSVLTLALGGLGALISGNYDVYEEVAKPPLAPPNWLFPIAWTILYILMGISAGNIAASRDLDKGKAIRLYLIQLIVNIFWPVIFFRFEAQKLALVWLALLIVLVILTIIVFKTIDKKSAWLLLPYLAWCIFAFYLNLGIIALNS